MKKTKGIDKDPKRVFYSFRGFTVHPFTSDIVYAMAEIGSPGWTPDGNAAIGLEMDLSMGVVFRTENGGEDWTEIWRGDSLARYCWINPSSPNIVYISTGIFDRESRNTDVQEGIAGGVGILKSTDGGDTWEVLNERNGLHDLYVGSLFMHPTNPDILLAAAAENNWSGYPGRPFTGGVSRTEDGGKWWSRVTTQPEIFSAVEFCTSNPSIAYAGSSRAIYLSVDAGLTWERFGRPDGTWGSPGVIAGWPIDIQCDPTDCNRVFINNYGGGNFLSTDGGRNWESACRGYTGSFMFSIAVLGESELYAAGRSGVFHTPDAGDTWIGLAFPDAALSKLRTRMDEVSALAAHPKRPERIVAAPEDIKGVIYTENAGRPWYKAAGIEHPLLEIVSVPNLRTRFFAAVTDPKFRDFLGLAEQDWSRWKDPGKGVYVSHDSGKTWARVPGKEVEGATVSTIAMHPQDPKVIYAATVDCDQRRAMLLLSVDGGARWTEIGSGLPEDIWVRSLAINPANPEIVFAGLNGKAVYGSADGGRTFAPSSNGLPAEAIITSVKMHPKWAGNPLKSRIYAGDRRNGVLMSEDGGTTWSKLDKGMVHKTVNTLGISPDGSMLYASIHGDGIYRVRPD